MSDLSAIVGFRHMPLGGSPAQAAGAAGYGEAFLDAIAVALPVPLPRGGI